MIAAYQQLMNGNHIAKMLTLKVIAIVKELWQNQNLDQDHAVEQCGNAKA